MKNPGRFKYSSMTCFQDARPAVQVRSASKKITQLANYIK